VFARHSSRVSALPTIILLSLYLIQLAYCIFGLVVRSVRFLSFESIYYYYFFFSIARNALAKLNRNCFVCQDLRAATLYRRSGWRPSTPASNRSCTVDFGGGGRRKSRRHTDHLTMPPRSRKKASKPAQPAKPTKKPKLGSETMELICATIGVTEPEKPPQVRGRFKPGK